MQGQTVTMLFSDIEGSTRLLERAGAASLTCSHRTIGSCAPWGEHGGVEEKLDGDAFFVLFADPTDAVEAAAEAQRRLAQHDWPGGFSVCVRMGLHTGPVERRDSELWGADIHYAARLGAAAHGGQVLLSAATARLVDAKAAPLGEHGLKDFAEPQPIFQLVVDVKGRRPCRRPEPSAGSPPACQARPTVCSGGPRWPQRSRDSASGGRRRGSCASRSPRQR